MVGRDTMRRSKSCSGKGLVVMEEKVRVFACTKHYHNWFLANCARCKKEDEFKFGCALTMAALKSLYFGGYLPESVAERIGFLDLDDTLKSEASPLWICRDFEPK